MSTILNAKLGDKHGPGWDSAIRVVEQKRLLEPLLLLVLVLLLLLLLLPLLLHQSALAATRNKLCPMMSFLRRHPAR